MKIKNFYNLTKVLSYNIYCKFLAYSYNINNFKNIYHFHIRKTGGSSINYMFLTLSGLKGDVLIEKLSKKYNHSLIINNQLYTGWNLDLLNKGNFYYGFSHYPFSMVKLKDSTYSFTIFRDPAKRVLSHYNMLLGFIKNEINHPCMSSEKNWVGKNFLEFLDRIPKNHLLTQLNMFSSSFDINEAVNNVKKLNNYFQLEDFDNCIKSLNKDLNLNLKKMHIKKSKFEYKIKDHELEYLKDLLKEEYKFLSLIGINYN